MNADYWKMENLCLEGCRLPENDADRMSMSPVGEETLQASNDQYYEVLVQRCSQICNMLKQLVIADVGSHQPNPEFHSFSGMFGNEHYVGGVPGVTGQDWDVKIIMEVKNISLSYLFNFFCDKLKVNSEQLGLDPHTVAISQYHPESNRFVIRFQLVGSHPGSKIELCLVPEALF